MAAPSTPERAPWPAHFATPQQVLAWLNSLKAQDGLTAKCLLAMRWLVLAELESSAPESAAKSITEFVPIEANGFDGKPLGTTTPQRR